MPESLEFIVGQHISTFPFENIDMHNALSDPNNPVKIDPGSIFNKMVRSQGHRGGYCFETTTLLKEVLTKLGFNVKVGIGSVDWLKEQRVALSHQFLIVRVGAIEFLVDPGFGQPGPLQFLVLRVNNKLCEAPQPSFPGHEVAAFKFVAEGETGFQLLAKMEHHPWLPEKEWKPLYGADLTLECDNSIIESRNHMVSVSRQSPFLERLIVTKPCEEQGMFSRITLSQRDVKRTSSMGTQMLASFSTEEELFAALEKYFSITLPKGSHLTAKDIRFAPKPPPLPLYNLTQQRRQECNSSDPSAIKVDHRREKLHA